MQPYVTRYKCKGAVEGDTFTMKWEKNGFFHLPVQCTTSGTW